MQTMCLAYSTRIRNSNVVPTHSMMETVGSNSLAMRRALLIQKLRVWSGYQVLAVSVKSKTGTSMED